MQAVTQHQGERILDVLDQCRSVTEAYERKCKAQEEGDGGEIAQKAYQAALAGLATVRRVALSNGVSDDLLTGLIAKHLPEIPQAA